MLVVVNFSSPGVEIFVGVDVVGDFDRAREVGFLQAALDRIGGADDGLRQHAGGKERHGRRGDKCSGVQHAVMLHRRQSCSAVRVVPGPAAVDSGQTEQLADGEPGEPDAESGARNDENEGDDGSHGVWDREGKGYAQPFSVIAGLFIGSAAGGLYGSERRMTKLALAGWREAIGVLN